MDILELKRLNRIEEVVAGFDEFALKDTRSRYLTALAHDSFVVDVERQMYNWNSQGRHGDVLNFLQNEQGMDWKGALSYLAKRAGVELTMTADQQKRYAAERKREDALDLILQFMVNKLGVSAAAGANEAEVSAGLAYARSRGWDDERIQSARLGFWDGDYTGLRQWLTTHNVDMADPAVVAVLGFNGDVAQWFRLKRPNDTPRADWVEKKRITGIVPADMLIYPHLEAGRVQYLSGRKLVDDDYGKSWNLNQALVGKKRPFWNDLVRGAKGPILVVEGQADAISAAAWEVPAVALCGSAADDGLIEMLGKFDQVFVCLDGDDAGSKNAGKLARLLPNSRVVRFPEREGVTDVNDLFKAGMTRGQFKRLMTEGDVYAVWLCRQVGAADMLDRERLANVAVEEYAKIDKKIRPNYRSDVAEALNWTVKRLDSVVRAIDDEAKQNAKKPDKTNKRYEFSLGGMRDGIAYEIVVDHEERQTAFATSYVNDDGEVVVEVKPELEFDDVIIEPIHYHMPEISGGYMYLPTKPIPYGSTKQLISMIQTHINKYVDVPEEVEEFAAVYGLLTWLADKLPVVPYLRALGDTGGGKTRFIQTVGSVAFRAAFLSGAGSTAAFFHLNDNFGMVTLVLDEMDVARGDETSEIVNIFNTGNRRSGAFGIARVTKIDDEFATKVYKTFGPKMVSMREEFKDKATNSRFWDWVTGYTTTREDMPTFLLDEFESTAENNFWGEAMVIRNMCLMYRMEHVHRQFEFDEKKVDRKLPGRFREMIFGAIAAFPELEEMLHRMAEKKLEQTVLDYQQTAEAKVLYALLRQFFRPIIKKDMFADGLKRAKLDDIAIENRTSMQAIADEVNRIIDIENNVNSNDDEPMSGNRFGKKYSYGGRRVSHILRVKLNIPVTRSTMGSRPTVAVWDAKRVEGLCVRYGLEDQLLAFVNGGNDFYDYEDKDNSQRDCLEMMRQVMEVA